MEWSREVSWSEVMTTKSIPISKISKWLRSQPETWWVVDGDYRLEGRLTMPASEQDLANALDKYCEAGEEVKVILPESKDAAGNSGVETLFTAGGDGYGRSLQAEGGDHDEGWLLVEQTEFVKEANREVDEFFQNKK